MTKSKDNDLKITPENIILLKCLGLLKKYPMTPT